MRSSSAFHQRHYHPSNAKLFFYGDDDPDERLRLLDAYLGAFGRIDIDAKVPLQPRFLAPKRLTRTYAAGSADPQAPSSDTAGAAAAAKETMLTVNWMLDEFVDVETGLAFDILEHILIGTAGLAALQGADRLAPGRGPHRRRSR